MSDTLTKDRPALVDPGASNWESSFDTPQRDNSVALVPTGAADQAMGRIITAQRVAIKRNLGDVMRRVREAATAAGDAMYYSWEVKEASGKKTRIEGASIDAAMLIVTQYGNCELKSFIESVTDTHITFGARFIDYETGFTFERLFRQFLGQNVGGRMDRARAEDMVFQIGQSKALRNCAVGALPILAKAAVRSAKSGIIERITKNPENALAWIMKTLAEMDVAPVRVAAAVGVPSNKWTVDIMAKLFAEIQSARDGFIHPDDAWPRQAAADIVIDKKLEDKPKPAATKRETKPKPVEAAVEVEAQVEVVQPVEQPVEAAHDEDGVIEEGDPEGPDDDAPPIDEEELKFD